MSAEDISALMIILWIAGIYLVTFLMLFLVSILDKILFHIGPTINDMKEVLSSLYADMETKDY